MFFLANKPVKYNFYVLVNPKQKYVGCYIDAAARAMTGTYFYSGEMTVELCVDSCGGFVSSHLQPTPFLPCLDVKWNIIT